MTPYPELILHIGAGKTGSTSVQFTLQRSREQLAAQGLGYLGLMLEEAEAARDMDWSVRGAPQAFFHVKDRKAADEEIVNVALTELRDLADRGITRVIWSNEAFLTRTKRILPIMRRIAEAGVRVVPLCYVRRHDAWASSGFVQFGIKRKHSEGALKRFADWVRDHDLAYAPSLSEWQQAFGQVEIYNYDAIDNVTEHFMARIGAAGLAGVRANDRPSNALLSAWAVFNGRLAGRAQPSVFQEVASRLKVLTSQGLSVPPLQELLPTCDELADIRAGYADDLAQVNAMLAAQGQKPLAQDHLDAPDGSVSCWEMDRMMLVMIFSLQRQVTALEDELARLRKGSQGDQT